ncbi:MAG TPA: Gfo/Idh/MocA family oxidoreductase [Ilumatobacteraceae bacterium]|nr:Gfo/Idh/MocA family oxidoreductase [Ilumatobacteraceae bacterium]
MSRLRVALVGCGLVGQAEHAFYLSTNRDLFDFAALVDASATVRAGVGDRYDIPIRVASVGELDASALDAIICATPDVFHSEVVLWALAHGLHVLCEKPLAFTLRECDEMIAARDKAGKVAQVGYMKRHDPAYLRLLELLPEDAAAIKCISIEVNDPNSKPFTAHLPMSVGTDVPAELRADGRRRAVEMVAEATGLGDIPVAASVAFQNAFLSSLVHDISMLHGILEHVGNVVPARLVDASIFAGGDGGSAGWQLDTGGRVTAFHLTLEGVNDYTERLTVYCTDRILELTFPAPYLRNMPTRLVERRSAGDIGLTETRHHVAYAEAFENELRSFHRSITGGAPVVVPLEAGRADVQGLLEAHAHATARLEATAS